MGIGMVTYFEPGMSPNSPCDKELVPSEELLGGSGTCKMWGFVGCLQVIGEHALKRNSGTPTPLFFFAH